MELNWLYARSVHRSDIPFRSNNVVQIIQDLSMLKLVTKKEKKVVPLLLL